VKGHQRAYLTWLLEQRTTTHAADDMLTPPALTLLAERLTTPLQIEHYLTRALEEGYKIGQKPLTPELIESVLARDLDD
jgi:type II secretory pathway predicted ATPase ExeA